MNFNWKLDRLNFLLVLILSSLVYFIAIFVYQNILKLAFLNTNEYKIESFSDKWDSGNSESTIILKTDNELDYSYQLGSKIKFPYAGILIKKFDDSFYNLENKKLIIQVYANQKQRFPIRIINFIEGKSDINNTNTYRLYENVYPLEKGENKLEIDFNTFTNTPEWWFSANKINRLDHKESNLKNVKHLSFYNDMSYPLGVKMEYKIVKLELGYNLFYLFYKYSIVLLIVYVILFYLYYKLNQFQTVKVINQLESNLTNHSLLSRIQGFFDLHYTNSELKTIDLATYLEVPEYKIADILKSTVKMNFKSCLNKIRIDNAKLLLLNSTLTISEIAYKVGFNSPSSFNRVFKDVTEKSPSEFKESALM